MFLVSFICSPVFGFIVCRFVAPDGVLCDPGEILGAGPTDAITGRLVEVFFTGHYSGAGWRLKHPSGVGTTAGSADDGWVEVVDGRHTGDIVFGRFVGVCATPA